ncbi:S-layer homology domain-containing protein [Cohnella nanjingensis]|uniref:S-layer homology domain-containing protein n=1 Tax=Cohnella nanjingensis TaxID=1387779 RepID=A0A7X0VF74_9BACL|nr:S-layer homology domain-containing protein [Cohnella nanjingensis]MBB6670314.1 S-layer homology domain-containing protein [Cohnella nanjingensis]
MRAMGNKPKAGAWWRAALGIALALQLALGAWPHGARAAEDGKAASTAGSADVGAAVDALQAIVAKGEPISDWAAFALSRAGQPQTSRYLPVAAKSVDQGELRLVTDYARVALALNASGGDAHSVGKDKTDLLKLIANYDKLTNQGPNGPAFALIALDAGGYIPGAQDKWSRDAILKWLVDNRNADGGWSIAKGTSDVDVTAIVLAALAKDQDRKDIRPVVDAALAWLSGVQKDNGGFGTPAESSESAAQVLIALTSLGIDPTADAHFAKSGHTALTRLLAYRLADGQFAHTPDGKADGMATLNALLGLTAVERWQHGLPSLYAGEAVGLTVDVTVNGLAGQVAAGSASGGTALEALVRVLDAGHVAYTVQRHPQFGPMLQSVAGVDNGKFGGYDGWQFAVWRDGAWLPIEVGLGAFVPKAGDKLVVYYGGGETAAIHGVKLDPATPRDGQPFTVSVEQETTDWTTGKKVVGPAAGAAVKAGKLSVVADAYGKAVFAGLAAGDYTLSVDGYQADAAPAYIAWSQPLQVGAYASQAQVRVEGDQGVLAAGAAKGGTALEAVEQLLKAKSVKYEVQNSAYGKYLSAVSGLASGKFGGYDGWMYAVKRDGAWIVPAVGIDAFLLEAGDEVVVYYGGDGTKLIDRVTLTPANPRPDQASVLSVTYREWDWNTNAFGEPQALANVTVSVGGQTVKTGIDGKAAIKGLKEGLQKLVVTGYNSGAAPSAVRYAADLPVVSAYKDESGIAAWASDAVHLARAVPLLKGTGNGTASFAPKQAVTRAEFVSALARSLGLPAAPAAGGVKFADVPSGAWYAKDVQAAASAGLAGGVAPGKFAPDEALTREQAAQLLARALKLQAPAKGAAALLDQAQVTKGALPSVQAVMARGWMTAYAGKFSPKAALSREQAAVVAVRLYEEPGVGAGAK